MLDGDFIFPGGKSWGRVGPVDPQLGYSLVTKDGEGVCPELQLGPTTHQLCQVKMDSPSAKERQPSSIVRHGTPDV